MTTKQFSLLLTCEHASCSIPDRYQQYFTDKEVLRSHEGWDIGAYDYFCALSHAFQCPSIHADHSRLLIELNRSPGHPKLFSRFIKNVPEETKEQIIQDYYIPYRSKVTNTINSLLTQKKPKPVLHLSCHSFTPVFEGKERKTDIAFLYDPQRFFEQAFCNQVKGLLAESGFRVRMNYPYKGTSDGLTTFLRRQFKPDEYLGIEIELNQAQLITPKPKQQIADALLKALTQALYD